MSDPVAGILALASAPGGTSALLIFALGVIATTLFVWLVLGLVGGDE